MVSEARIAPVVRYHLLCEDWWVDELRPQRVTIDGLISNIHVLDDPPYPYLLEEFCVFLAVTGGRGDGAGYILCRFEETGEEMFRTPPRTIAFPANPLEIVGIAFRIRNCWFPIPGRYSVEFWYNEEKVSEQSLLMR